MKYRLLVTGALASTLFTSCLSPYEVNTNPLGMTTRTEVQADAQKFEATAALQQQQSTDATNLQIAQVNAETLRQQALYQKQATEIIWTHMYSMTQRQAQMEETLGAITYQVQLSQFESDSEWGWKLVAIIFVICFDVIALGFLIVWITSMFKNPKPTAVEHTANGIDEQLERLR